MNLHLLFRLVSACYLPVISPVFYTAELSVRFADTALRAIGGQKSKHIRRNRKKAQFLEWKLVRQRPHPPPDSLLYVPTFLGVSKKRRHFRCLGTTKAGRADVPYTRGLVRWLKSYGVPRSVIDKMLETPPNAIAVISEDELRAMGATLRRCR